jgi:16S rRNA (cytosine1402-N4)-methyltransferase
MTTLERTRSRRKKTDFLATTVNYLKKSDDSLTAPAIHTPVLLDEAIELLGVQPGGRYIDATVGTGGHALAILEESLPGGQLLGLDIDPEAIVIAKNRISPYAQSALLLNENFAHLEEICHQYQFYPVHGILFDLGLCSLQLAGNRGFSFKVDAPLDMRFSPNQSLTAAEIVNSFPEAELATIIKQYGEEPKSWQIAREIVRHRPIQSSLQLAEVVAKVVGRNGGRIHPATRTFQALRIMVNQELANLERALRGAINLLGYGGRLVVISYHSLEDRLVKELLGQESKGCICPPEAPVCTCGHTAKLKLVNKKVITPSAEEVARNPRSRSAKLRVAECIIYPTK